MSDFNDGQGEQYGSDDGAVTSTGSTVTAGTTGTAGTTTATTSITDNSPDAPQAETSDAVEHAAATSAVTGTSATLSATAQAQERVEVLLSGQGPGHSADVVLNGTTSNDVEVTAQTSNAIVSNFTHADTVTFSADLVQEILSGQLTASATSTSVEVDNAATGQMIVHINLDHALTSIGIHPQANGAVSVTL